MMRATRGVAMPLVAAVVVALHAASPARASDQAGHEPVAFPETMRLDVFDIASSRTMYLPAAPPGKVTVQLVATAVGAAIPGRFRFHLAAPEAGEVFQTVSAARGEPVPKGAALENGVAFVEPGRFYTLQVVYENPSDSDVTFLVSAPQVDPLVALPFARAKCWCAAIPFTAPAGGTFSRTIAVGVGPDTPPGAKAIVEWPVIRIDE